MFGDRSSFPSATWDILQGPASRVRDGQEHGFATVTMPAPPSTCPDTQGQKD